MVLDCFGFDDENEDDDEDDGYGVSRAACFVVPAQFPGSVRGSWNSPPN